MHWEMNEAEKCEGVGSSDEDQDGNSGREADPQEMDPSEEKELKQHLLKKYGGCLSGLRQELSKKKKKGKLPKDARQKLLNWWELHHKWPYPSVCPTSLSSQIANLAICSSVQTRFGN